MLRTNTCGELRAKDAGKKITLCGWVDAHRIQGKLSFIMLRDRYGITQIFVNPKITKEIGEIRRESVIQVKGEVKKRPDNQIKKELATGEIEVSADEVNILSKAAPLPLELDESVSSTEEIRLKYRYLDLRRPRMIKNLTLRHKAIQFIRDYLDKKDFLDVTTPILTKSTPEGARDYLVPSRIHKGKFYALPQSPQQYKQLLMVAGIDKYYQIAPCFRDEDSRADRCPGEFYQLDLEMSFVEQEDILKITEDLFIKMVEKVFPDKKISQIPFPRISHKEAMEKYKSDKPDIRKNKDDKNELAFCWILDFPLFNKQTEEDFFHGAGQEWGPSHHMFTAPKEEHLHLLDKEPGEVRSYQHDLVLNGFEVGGGSIRIHDPDVQAKIFDLIGFDEKQKKEFAHLLEAFTYGVPPHGGIAPGIDRLIMVILGEDHIREVIAFPKDKSAKDPVMNAPSEVTKGQLDELGLKIDKK
ncbi:MAG: aspartate--tRNA ligase [Nanoarchaeota archaeon]|nr:aspartate--tRNA ligase [Nanoarchaeota archaeon]MBU1320731.1 aspartate--tRNA ligase [Nanoarchaeota archaeon]MBU1596985.1 aspartate--tRNA ligase [Nanoarchaeota archaeon]MBU2441962.1 aspartate--tRNA ligase [Nanoarchaeota archaeon]